MFIRIFSDDNLNRKIYTTLTEAGLKASIKMAKYHSNDFFKFTYTDDCEYLLKSKRAIPQLIIKETLSNGIKHNNVNYPQIIIDLSKQNEYYILKIKVMRLPDDEDMEKLNDPFNKTKRNGLKIIKRYSEYLGWEWHKEKLIEEKALLITFKIPVK
jgi:hypothetical protein